jgi:ABC-type polysaccharide/polyol phosphate export permease
MKTIPNTPIYDSAKRQLAPLDELLEIFHFRHLIWQLIRRDITARYKRSFLGVAWTMLNPLGMMLVWTVAFSQVFGASREGYAAYVLNGILAWTFFSQTTTASMVNLVWGGGLLNRIYIPRTSFAISAVGTGMINLLFGLIPMFIVLLVSGIPITTGILFLPFAMLLLACFSLGLGLLISTLAVYFPDVSEMYQIVLLAWMFLTPVMYPEELLHGGREILLVINPMTHLIKLYRLPLYYGQFPTAQELAVGIVLSLSVLVIGWIAFTRKANEFAYRL